MEKKLRCKLGWHEWEGKGNIKTCKFCEISDIEAFWSEKNQRRHRGE